MAKGRLEMASRRPRARGALEQELLACLAAAQGPLTAAQVRDELGHDTAYTTVMTTLARLHEKRALERTQAGRAYAYALVGEPLDAHANVTAHRMHRLLDEQPDRAGVLARFVAQLDRYEEDMLAKLLERNTRAGRGSAFAGRRPRS